MQVSQEDRVTLPASEKSTSNYPMIIIALLIIFCAGGYFYFSKDEAEEIDPVVASPMELPEPAPISPIDETPIEEPTELTTQTIDSVEGTSAEDDDVVPLGEGETESQPAVAVIPLPKLDESDDFLEQKTLAIANGMKIGPLILKKDMARQFVVFVDNLAQGDIARKASPLKGPYTKFSVSEISLKTYLNPDSYHRYDLYTNFISGLNEKDLVASYNELKPLFKEAFNELGYSDVTFDDRMKQAFNIILDAPIIETPIELTSVSVNYLFADPELEALPDAQKFLIRMGPENTLKLKEAVKKLQKHIVK